MKKSICILSTIVLACLYSCVEKNHPDAINQQIFHNAAVASGKPAASEAGVSMFKKGGNAVDAAVATAFALSVVEPSMSGLGGRMQAIVRLENGEIVGLDATTIVPTSYDTNVVSKKIYGYHVIGVPGVVAGLTKLLDEHGNLSLETVMAPAIALAENGYPISAIESQMHKAVLPQLKEFKGTAQHFLKDYEYSYSAGEKFVQTDLAKTLKLIASKGPDVFYKGEIAQKIVEDNQQNGGVLSLEDLKNYEVKSSQILETSYKGYDLYGLWLPSFGAITLEIMNVLEVLNLETTSETDWIEAVYQAMKIGYADRLLQYEPEINPSHFTSKSRATELVAKNTTRSANELEQNGHTTNLVSCDSKGMMVVLTQSLGPIMGSKVTTPGLGFMHATASGKYLMAFEPGMRTSSHISPMIIEKNGHAFLGIGAAGGSRIVTAITNVLSRVIDHKMDISDAVLAPRVYPHPDSIHLEYGTIMGWDPEIIENLKKRSLGVTLQPDPTHFGIVHAIMYDTISNKWIPTAEPDWDGLGLATEK